jgi:fructan beta-fructosidase
MYSKFLIPLLLILSVSCSNFPKGKDKQPDIHFTIANKYHVSPIELLYLNNEYHLFYQYTTSEDDKEQKYFGHAKSTDFIKWNDVKSEVQPIKGGLFEYGCIVNDLNNTSGIGNEQSPLITYFTNKNADTQPNIQTFQLAVSLDNGNTWQNQEINATLNNSNYRPNDIKIIWSEERQKWIMLALSGYEVKFYSSDNLINWEYESTYGEDIYSKTGEWTQLDFFPLEVEGKQEIKWILFISSDLGAPNGGSGIQYFIGDFDGYTFHSTHNKPKWIDNGSDLTNGIVLSDYSNINKPAFFIGCVKNSRYNQFAIDSMKADPISLVRKLTLRDKFNDFYICSKPEIASAELNGKQQLLKEKKFSGELKITKEQSLPLVINLKFEVNNRLYLDFAEAFGIRLTNEDNEKLEVGYHSQRRYFYIADPKFNEDAQTSWDGFDYAPYVIDTSEMDIKIIIDSSGIELFAMNGLITLTRKNITKKDWTKISLFSENGSITLSEGNITELN